MAILILSYSPKAAPFSLIIRKIEFYTLQSVSFSERGWGTLIMTFFMLPFNSLIIFLHPYVSNTETTSLDFYTARAVSKLGVLWTFFLGL